MKLQRNRVLGGDNDLKPKNKINGAASIIVIVITALEKIEKKNETAEHLFHRSLINYNPC